MNPEDIPRKNKKKQGVINFAQWSGSKMQDGYDSVQYSKDGWDCTVLWCPYALIATHKVYLNKDALIRIAAEMSNGQRTLCWPRYIHYQMSQGNERTIIFDLHAL
jgi:hypothetical protein